MVHKQHDDRKPGVTQGKSSPLGSVSCLRGLDPAILNRLQKTVREKEYRRGELLFQEGTICEEIFVITEGTVKVYRLTYDGRQQTLWILGKGDCFCLAPLFHQVPYPVTAQCLSEVRGLKLGKENGMALLEPEDGMAAGVIQCLCHRLASMATRVEAFSAKGVRHRLARILLDLAHQSGDATEGGVLVDAGLTHEELASCAGTAREVVSRTLEAFQREGLIQLGRRRLLIYDLPRLEEVLLSEFPSKSPLR